MSFIRMVINLIKLSFRRKIRWKRIADYSHFSSTDIDYKLSDKGEVLHAWELASLLIECDPDSVVMANGKLVTKARKHHENKSWATYPNYIDLMAAGVEEHSSVDWAAAKTERI